MSRNIQINYHIKWYYLEFKLSNREPKFQQDQLQLTSSTLQQVTTSVDCVEVSGVYNLPS